MTNIPRAGTRIRAVYDALTDGREHRWRYLLEVYIAAKDPPPVRSYVGVELSRILKRFARKVRRGVYVLRDIKAQEAVVPAVPRNCGSPGCSCGNPHKAPEPPAKNTGPEPRMDDICGTCGVRYGHHYGDRWPAPADCPTMVDGRPSRRPESERVQFWTDYTAVVPWSIGSRVVVADLGGGLDKVARIGDVLTIRGRMESNVKPHRWLLDFDEIHGGWFDTRFTVATPEQIRAAAAGRDASFLVERIRKARLLVSESRSFVSGLRGAKLSDIIDFLGDLEDNLDKVIAALDGERG